MTKYYKAAWSNLLERDVKNWCKDSTIWKCEPMNPYFGTWYIYKGKGRWKTYAELPNAHYPSHVWLDEITEEEAFIDLL